MSREPIGVPVVDDEVIDEDAFYEGGITALEEREHLERAGREGAQVEIDIADRGPLYQYALFRRTTAVDHMKALIDADPRDGVAIAALQSVIREYLQVARWARGVIEKANEAEKIINEDYKGNDQDRHED